MKILKSNLNIIFGKEIFLNEKFDEITIDISTKNYIYICEILRTEKKLCFDICIDLCCIDYIYWQNDKNAVKNYKFIKSRFALVIHLLSTIHNERLRVRTWLENENIPIIPTLINCWPSVNWFEREAFDLYGIIFDGHTDLRRILTDYGFIGNPFRKDFNISGNNEMRYDYKQNRVIYQPITIKRREIIPRIIRRKS